MEYFTAHFEIALDLPVKYLSTIDIRLEILMKHHHNCDNNNNILAYNIFHGHLDFPLTDFFEAPAERNLRGHDFKMRHRSFR